MNYANENARAEFNAFFGDTPRKATPTTVGFKRLTDTAVIPTKAHPSDSGFDLFADETVIIEPGSTYVVKTGIAVVLPQGYEATVRPRSGITTRTKLRVQLGTVDNAYRGDIGIIVDNVADEGHEREYRIKQLDGSTCDFEPAIDFNSYIIRKGDKLAQMVVSPMAVFAGTEVFDITSETDRGTNGFGSSGTRL